MKRTSAGFTLLEVILAVSLMIIIGSFSMSFATNFFLQNAAGNTQAQFIGEMRKAQMYAMSSKENSAWGIYYNANTITLFKGNSYITRDATWDERYVSNANLIVSGFSEVVFARLTGLPSTTGTITITGNGSSKTVTVNSQGVIGQ